MRSSMEAEPRFCFWNMATLAGRYANVEQRFRCWKTPARTTAIESPCSSADAVENRYAATSLLHRESGVTVDLNGTDTSA